MFCELIIQLQQGDGSFSCEKYDQFPSPQSTYVAICFTNNSNSEQIAKDFKELLLKELGAAHLPFIRSDPPCGGAGISFNHCSALSIPDNRKLLFVVSDGLSNHFDNTDVLNWQHSVLAILPDGARVTLPDPFSSPQVAFWKRDIGEVIPDAFAMLGISDEDWKVFISYRRSDASEFAEQMFDELNRVNFDVFLDRFSINPGVSFQNRLYQELADKSMVVFLESPDFLTSNWVQMEIAFAKANRLGYLAINIMDAPKTPDIEDENRISFDFSELNGNTLSPNALSAAVMRIRKQHGLAILRMRNTLKENLIAAFNGRNVTVVPEKGFLRVTNNVNSNSFMIWPTPRPPQVNDYFISHGASNVGQTKVIFGPSFVEQKRRTINDWLSSTADTRFYNEGEILTLVNEVI